MAKESRVPRPGLGKLVGGEAAQATMEWAILIVPFVFLLMIPIEWGMRFRVRLVSLNGLQYAVWNNATKSTDEEADSATMGELISKYAKVVDPRISTGSVEGADSFDSFSGTLGSVVKPVIYYFACWPSTFLRDRFNTWQKGEIKVAYDSQLGGLLTGFYATMMRQDVNNAESANKFEVEWAHSMIGDSWIPVTGDDYNESFDSQTFENHILDSWGIDVLPILNSIKSIYNTVVNVVDTAIKVIDNLVDITAVYDFGPPWFGKKTVGYGKPWGRITAGKDVAPRNSGNEPEAPDSPGH